MVQMLLDGFAPVVAPAISANEPKIPLAPDTQAQPAIEKIAPAPLAEVLAPARFVHPQANRELRLESATVAYRLDRARRRTIGFTVGPEGLAVRAPTWATLAAVDGVLREKSGWVLRKLQELEQRQARQAHARIQWGDGAELPYLGAPLRVVLDARHSLLGVLQDGASGWLLYMGLPGHAQPAQVRDAVQAWLMRHARLHFITRLDHFAPQLQVRWTRLRLSSAQTRWGSARADGSISLNWRLLHYPQAVIDYVVVHELAHLRVMDHSPQFWSTVASVVPDHAQLRRHLREQPAPDWDDTL